MPYKNNLSTSLDPCPAHLTQLRQGVAAWNAWRAAHADIQPNLAGVDFTAASPIFGFGFGILVAALTSMLWPRIAWPEAIVSGLVFALLFCLAKTPYAQRAAFELWGLFDFGRSWRRVGIFALATILLFGFLFSIAGEDNISFAGANTPVSPQIVLTANPLHPYVFAAAGFVSGGLLGLAGVQSNLGLLLVVANGLFGVATFGLFISALSATFSRQG